MIEQTLIIFKPHAVQRGVVGEILSRFEKVGLKIVAAKMVFPSEEHYHTHYEEIGKMITRRGEQTFKVALEMMQQGPVIAMVLEGVEAVSQVRKMVGATEPKSANPGTIRGDYAHMSFAYADKKNSDVYNLIHASGDPEEAKKEIAHWFSKSEIFDYPTVHEVFTQAKKK
ncbi:MAG TPA: nucleoside-diphosphate kinase [Patescibacteria group bacterium]|nr:nucleoside-diphosphate kinase [Patescibacteria group bacterium]